MLEDIETEGRECEVQMEESMDRAAQNSKRQEPTTTIESLGHGCPVGRGHKAGIYLDFRLFHLLYLF